MAKKILDILPPKKLKKEKPEKEPFLLFKKPEFKIKKGLIFIPLVLILIGIFCYFTLSRAEIEIWPETEIKTFKTRLTVDKRIENINFLANLIPGIIFEEEKTFSQEFPARGKKLLERKAEGVIRVFNDSQTNQTLVSQTRFQPPLEKFRLTLEKNEYPWFRSTERIVIPAKSYKDVKVVAEAPGEKYNIEPSTFSIPGLAGTPQYTFVYGKSFEPMKGGLKKEVSEVTPEDLKEAEKILREKALKETKDALKGKIPADFIFLEEALKTEILEIFSLARAGAELEKFTFQLKALALTLAFKKGDLENFSKEFIATKIGADKKIDQKSLKIEYLPEIINLEAGKIILSLNLEAKIYSDIDEISLKRGLLGKSLAETQFFLQNQPKVNRSEVKLWPFWVRKVPQEMEKIKIKLNLD